MAGGNVSYVHAGGIDRPLVITKGTTSIVPHMNWRGQFARGTYADGAKVRQRSDCTSFPAMDCVTIQWPGERTTARHELEPDGNIQNWFGGLVDDMRDASGQMYKRNRYYDPQTGQFTQPDPIGLAGGLNEYGFAAGDPVTYGDPYGLRACPIEAGGDGQTDRFDDCPPGSPGWYANRIANREGSSALNFLGGVFSACGHSTRCMRTLIRPLPGASRVFSRIVDNARKYAVRRAWADERAMVAATGSGTVEWTAEEMDELLRVGTVSGYDGHHINNVADNLHLAGNPANIKFVRKGKDHLAEHGGNTHNPSSGPLIDRSY